MRSTGKKLARLNSETTTLPIEILLLAEVRNSFELTPTERKTASL